MKKKTEEVNYMNVMFKDVKGNLITSRYFSNVLFATKEGLTEMVENPNMMFKNDSSSGSYNIEVSKAEAYDSMYA